MGKVLDEQGPLELMQKGVTDGDASDRMLSGYEMKLTVNKKTGCWNWMGESTIHGYPSHWDDRAGVNRLVAHMMYAMFVDWNSDDKSLSQLNEDKMPRLRCRNKLCVNPAHLMVDAVTDKSGREKAIEKEKVSRELKAARGWVTTRASIWDKG
jgi:hypothetical protein